MIAVVLLLVAALLAGEARWRWQTRAIRRELEGRASARGAATFDPRELEGLPAPVRRYFERALRPRQPLVRAARLTTTGTFRADLSKDAWTPFQADQLVVAHPPGFDWDARIRTAPLLRVFVRDAYRAGAGLLRADALGLVPVARQEGTADAARGELLRWLAEACWLPTALLPSQGVRWEALDENRARATVVDGGTIASLDVTFGADGLVASVFAPDRPRIVGDRNVPAKWEGTWTAYGPRNGMRVPSAGEVAWILPEGRLPYWRGRVTSVLYTFAEETGR